MRFAEQVCIVTGGARGLGLGIARRLIAEGGRVALLDRDHTALAAVSALLPEGAEFLTFGVDVTRDDQVSEAVEQIHETWGRIDVLVNNAGILRPGDLFGASEEQMTETFAVNVGGTLRMTRHVARKMIEDGKGGSIVHISSITAAQGAPQLLIYSASKGAISSMTRAMAINLAEHKIRVNAVAPGLIETELTTNFYRDDPAGVDRVMSRTPLGRIGTPEDVAAAVAFLASSDAAYFTGQVLYPEGGRLALSYTMDHRRS